MLLSHQFFVCCLFTKEHANGHQELLTLNLNKSGPRTHGLLSKTVEMGSS